MGEKPDKRGTRAVAAALMSAVIVGALTITLAPSAAAVPPPPPNPSDQEISASESHAQATAAEVGKLSGKLSTTQTKIQQLQNSMELKAELAMKARVDLQTAEHAADDARAAADDAQQAADDAKNDVAAAKDHAADFAAASFRQGHTIGSMTVLLNSASMDQLVAKKQMIEQVAGSQTGVISALHSAQATQANLDSAARQALDDANDAQAAAEQAKKDAEKAQADAATAYDQGQRQLKKLEDILEAQQAEYQAAVNTVADLKGQRAQHAAWQVAKQEELQRIQQQTEALETQQAVSEKQRKLEKQEEQQAMAKRKKAVAAEKKRQEQLRKQREAAGKKGGSKDSSSSKPDPTPPGNSVGDKVVNAALAYLGTRYSWGGGNKYGPTKGIRDGGVADRYGDYKNVGFDCSGLALYAWAQVGVYLPHYSGYQYNVGKHVSRSNLRPGDLVFFAYNTSNPATIHHVAIYIGNGQMVEAPYSGSHVRIMPLRTSGYIGATRPNA